MCVCIIASTCVKAADGIFVNKSKTFGEIVDQRLSRGANRVLTPARCQDRRKLFVPAVAGREMLGVPYINRP